MLHQCISLRHDQCMSLRRAKTKFPLIHYKLNKKNCLS